MLKLNESIYKIFSYKLFKITNLCIGYYLYFNFYLNLLTEFEFFREIDVQYYFPIYLSLINSPSLLFEMFPFIFLIALGLFYKSFENDQIKI